MENKKKEDWWKLTIIYTYNKSHCIMECTDASSLVQLLWNLVKVKFWFPEEDKGISAVHVLVTLMLRGLSAMRNGRGRSLYCFSCFKKWNLLPSLFLCYLWPGNHNGFYLKNRTSWLHYAQFVLSRSFVFLFAVGE